MLNDIKDLDIDSLLKFLNKHNNRLQLDDEDFFTLKDNKILGARFISSLKKKDFVKMGLNIGPVVSLNEFVSDIKLGKFYFYYFYYLIFNNIKNQLFVGRFVDNFIKETK
jgi:hypothetical protein